MKSVYTTEFSDLSFNVNSVMQVQIAKHLSVKADAFYSAGIKLIEFLGLKANSLNHIPVAVDILTLPCIGFSYLSIFVCKNSYKFFILHFNIFQLWNSGLL